MHTRVLPKPFGRAWSDQLASPSSVPSSYYRVLMASLVPRVIKEKLDRKETLVPLAHKVPLVLLGHR